MPSINDWVKQLSEGIVTLLITGNTSNSHYKGMARVVNTSLDSLVESKPIGSDFVTKSLIHLRGEALGHPVVVLGKLRIVSACWEFGAGSHC